jgi:hypothetical protein
VFEEEAVDEDVAAADCHSWDVNSASAEVIL